MAETTDQTLPPFAVSAVVRNQLNDEQLDILASPYSRAALGQLATGIGVRLPKNPRFLFVTPDYGIDTREPPISPTEEHTDVVVRLHPYKGQGLSEEMLTANVFRALAALRRQHQNQVMNRIGGFLMSVGLLGSGFEKVAQHNDKLSQAGLGIFFAGGALFTFAHNRNKEPKTRNMDEIVMHFPAPFQLRDRQH